MDCQNHNFGPLPELGALEEVSLRRDGGQGGGKMFQFWLKERGHEPEIYCPAKINKDYEVIGVVTGMNLMGKPKGKIIGEFWHDVDDGLQIELYE